MSEIKLCLLNYHATPISSDLDSPHNLLLNRTVKCQLPILRSKLSTDNDRINRDILVDRQLKSATYYNRDAKPKFHHFKSGDIVVYRNGNDHKDDWKHAKVISVDPNFRSCTLLNQKGNIITRSRDHILPDKTGRDFYVDADDCLPSVKNPPHEPIQQAKIRSPSQNNPPDVVSASDPHSFTPPKNQIPLLVPKTTIDPNVSKMIKLNEYAKRHNTRVLPKVLDKPKNIDPSLVMPRRSERLANKQKVNNL